MAVAEHAEHHEANTTIDELLPFGLEPQDVCDEYFEACASKNPERWLACLHLERRATATSTKPGPFDVCNWDLGRARVEKYMVHYKLIGQVGQESLRNAEPMVVMEYQPVYGPVPGYAEGEALGPTIEIMLQKQGGVQGRWRVMDGTF